MTESEKIALCAVLGVAEVISTDFIEMIDSHPQQKQQIVSIRDDIDNLVGASEAKTKEALNKINDLEAELSDLKYNVKELLYRIEERRDVRNDLHYKDLKNTMGIL